MLPRKLLVHAGFDFGITNKFLHSSRIPSQDPTALKTGAMTSQRLAQESDFCIICVLNHNIVPRQNFLSLLLSAITYYSFNLFLFSFVSISTSNSDTQTFFFLKRSQFYPG